MQNRLTIKKLVPILVSLIILIIVIWCLRFRLLLQVGLSKYIGNGCILSDYYVIDNTLCLDINTYSRKNSSVFDDADDYVIFVSALEKRHFSYLDGIENYQLQIDGQNFIYKHADIYEVSFRSTYFSNDLRMIPIESFKEKGIDLWRISGDLNVILYFNNNACTELDLSYYNNAVFYSSTNVYDFSIYENDEYQHNGLVDNIIIFTSSPQSYDLEYIQSVFPNAKIVLEKL